MSRHISRHRAEDDSKRLVRKFTASSRGASSTVLSVEACGPGGLNSPRQLHVQRETMIPSSGRSSVLLVLRLLVSFVPELLSVRSWDTSPLLGPEDRLEF